MTRNLVLLICSLTLLGCSEIDKTNLPSEDINELMNYCYENGIFNGSIIVNIGDEILYKNGFGYTNKSNTTLINPSSSFYIASVSKQFTAMSIMILKKDGRLSYDDKLDKFFPEFPEYAKQISIRNLLTHTSGITDYLRLGIYEPGLTNNDVFNAIKEQETLDFLPGERFAYSNSGYVLLAMIVEKVSQMTIVKFMKENIFTPLGMSNTLVYTDSTQSIHERVTGYNSIGDLNDYSILTVGDGGIYSNAQDLMKWDRALYTEKLVPTKILNEAFSELVPAPMIQQAFNEPNPVFYGFGWMVTKDTTSHTVFHSGSLSGFRALIYRELNTKFSCILLTNHGADRSDLSNISKEILRITKGEDWNYPKAHILPTMVRILKEFEIDSAVNFYNEMKDEQPEKFDFKEEDLNSLGYYLMSQDKPKDANAIFYLNTKQFPESSNNYDSYAESFFILEEYEESKIFYQKSFDLDSTNTNAAEMIKKIDETISNNSFHE